MIAVDQSQVEFETTQLINYISPIIRANDTRHAIVAFIRDILHKSALLDGFVIECGSSALKSYLPESDLDLVLLAPTIRNNREEIQCLTAIFNSWCDEIADKDEGKSSHTEMTIRNVEFVNARTKLAHCLVNNIPVDITVNQIGAILTLTFLEEADRLIGGEHLFKKSLLLIKSWCLHESVRYCGSAITGAKAGMLSSYAVGVLVLHIFNKYCNLTHPFSVLRSFLYTYMSFPWDTHVLTVDGAVPLSSFSCSSAGASSGGGYHGTPTGRASVSDNSDLVSVSTHNSNASSQGGHPRDHRFSTAQAPMGSPSDPSNRFQSLLDRLAQHPALHLYQLGGSAVHHGRFTAKCCNIQDPIDAFNNLGISVPRSSLQLITQACRSGFHHLEAVLRRYPHFAPGNGHSTSTGMAMSASITGTVDGQEYSHSVLQQAAHESGNSYKYSNGKVVKQMLQPVPPANLGFIGSANAVTPSGQLRSGDTGNPYSPCENSGVPDSIKISSISSHSNSNSMGTSFSAATASAPFRRNSRGGQQQKPQQMSFLAEIFPVSLQLYCSLEGEPLRCDLLSHPLQPLSSSSILTHPQYTGGVPPPPSGGSQGSPRWEPGTPSQQKPARSQSITSPGDGLHYSDAASITSLNSGTTDQASASASIARSQQATSFGQQSVHSYHSAQLPPVPDPLLGDLEAMYEALDLFVSSRQAQVPPHTPPRPAGSSSDQDANSKQPLQPTAAFNRVESNTAARFKASPSVTALCVAEITALAATAMSSKAVTPAGTKGLLRQTPLVGFSRPDLPRSGAGDGSSARDSSSALPGGRDGSPDGSTTSGTDSVRHRADTAEISISDDSISAGDSEGESGSVEADNRSSSAQRGEPPTQVQFDLLGIAASAIPYVPPRADGPEGVVPVIPVGSVLAFFRDRVQWSSAWSSSVKGWTASLWSRGAEAKEDATEPPVLNVPNAATAARVPLPSGRRKGSKTTGGTTHTGGQQTARPNQLISASTERVRSPNSKVDKRTSAAAAAATRRSKRSAVRRLYSAAALWCERCWDTSKEALSQSPPLYPRPLLTALLYSVVMVLLLNLILTCAGPQIPTAREYTQFIQSTTLASANYTETLSQLQVWLRESSATALEHAFRAAAGSVQNPFRRASPGVRETTEAIAAVEETESAPTAYGFAVHSASQFARFSQDSLLDGASSLLLSRHPTAATGGSVGHGPLVGNAPGGGALVPPTHWVKEGDSISFGDFGSYSSAAALGPKTSAATPKTPSSSTTIANGARSTASTTSTKSRTPAVPSEYVQKTQFVPKPEYVLAANSQLGSPYLYQWTKDGANISNSFYQNQPFFSIKRADQADAGIYRCLRYDVAVSGAPPVVLLETALQISKPPTVSLKPSYHEIQAGSTMVLNLAAEGTPPPVFQWFKNGYPVPGLTAQVLLMEGVNSSHSGTYSCDVQNVAGGFVWLEATILVLE